MRSYRLALPQLIACGVVVPFLYFAFRESI
jgi:hypothetical protein